MPLLASSLLHPDLAGLFIAGAVAAMMSTADAQLLVSTSAVTEDFFHQFLGKNLSEDYQVHILDLRNHGRSPHSSDFDYDVMCDDLRIYIEKY